MLWGSYPKTYNANSPTPGPDHYSDSSWEDIPPVRNYIRRLIEDIHCEGSLVSYIGQVGGGSAPSPGGGGGGAPQGGGQGGQMPQGEMPQGEMTEGGMQGGPQGGGQMPEGMEMPEGMQGGGPQGGGQGGGQAGGQGGGGGSTTSVEEFLAQAKEAEEMGFDVFMMQSTNTEAMTAIRNQTKLLVLAKATVGGGMMGGPGGGGSTTKKWNYEGARYDWSLGSNAPGITNVNRPTDEQIQQAVELAKKLEGFADMLWIRDGRHEHPNSFIQDKEKPFNLYYAEAIKKAGVNIVVVPTAGFHDVVQNDGFIANGQTDMVGMTTPFFADPEAIKKASEGRPEDITPCLMCQDCHGISRTAGPWFDSCNVNPKWAVPLYKLKNIPAPTTVKKVAVIGGGPGGMKAALTAAERGHKVTLYEKGDALGGLLQFTDNAQWKWTYRDFKDHLINQVKKAGIEVKLGAEATPKMIKSKGYDTVLVATGAEVVQSKMKASGGTTVLDIMDAYKKKDQIKGDVVLIGAGRIGTECAIGIVKDGHKVFQIATGDYLFELECIGAHNQMNQILILEGHPDYSCTFNAMPKKIADGKVYYTDSEGKEQSVKADTVVLFNGFRPRTDEAEEFFGAANQVLFVGHCTGKNSTIQLTMRSAFFMASQI
jgi:thioredoxin reductase